MKAKAPIASCLYPGTTLTRLLTLAAAAIALSCSGCFERQVKSRGASGIVLDSATHLPVGGARVAVSEFPYYDEKRSLSNVMMQIRKPTATTDSEGFFAIPPMYRWVMSLPLGDYWPPSGMLLI